MRLPLITPAVLCWATCSTAQTLRPSAPLPAPAKVRTAPIAFVGLHPTLPSLSTPPIAFRGGSTPPAEVRSPLIAFSGLHPTLPDARTPAIAFGGAAALSPPVRTPPVRFVGLHS